MADKSPPTPPPEPRPDVGEVFKYIQEGAKPNEKPPRNDK